MSDHNFQTVAARMGLALLNEKNKFMDLMTDGFKGPMCTSEDHLQSNMEYNLPNYVKINV